MHMKDKHEVSAGRKLGLEEEEKERRKREH
jgi:hypothetical protein